MGFLNIQIYVGTNHFIIVFAVNLLYVYTFHKFDRSSDHQNCRGVRVFGELEFWFSSIKVIVLIALILFGIIVDLGGNPKRERIGFRYWRPPK